MFTNYYTLVAWGANPRPESGIFDTNLGRVETATGLELLQDFFRKTDLNV